MKLRIRAKEIPPTFAEFAKIPGDVAATAKNLVLHLRVIDEQLLKIDELLNRIQPPRTGKIRIEFYKSYGKHYPRPVIWKRTKGNNWRCEIVSWVGLTRHIKKARGFHEGAPIIKKLLTTACDLIVKRQAAIKRIGVFNSTVGVVIATSREKIGKHCVWVANMLVTTPMIDWNE